MSSAFKNYTKYKYFVEVPFYYDVNIFKRHLNHNMLRPPTQPLMVIYVLVYENGRAKHCFFGKTR